MILENLQGLLWELYNASLMKVIFDLFRILVVTSLVSVILLQAKGVGLSATFGGEGSFYRSRRGMEKLLFYATILLAVLFAATSIIGLLII